MKKTIFSILLMTVAFAAATVAYSQNKLKYSLNEYIDRLEMKPRKSMTKRPFVFPRSQYQYGHCQNYLNWWVDRPLIMERSLRYPTGKFEHIMKEDFLQNTIPIVKKYDVDGLASISSPAGHYRMYENTVKWLKEADIKGFMQLPEFSGGGGLDNRSYKYYTQLLKQTLSNPCAFRINGKVVISNYVAYRWRNSQKLKTLLDKLRAEHGDTFYFVADVVVPLNRFVRDKMVSRNLKASQPPKQELENLKNTLRSWLDVSDGILCAGIGHMASPGHTYADKFDETYYRDFIIPTMAEILAEPEYNGKKLLGLSAVIGYTNFLSGVNHSESNTRRLRQSFEAAIGAKPDFVILPEWNEVNENTCIQPTVSNGWTTQRILKYFMSFVKNKKASPNKGDDLSIPNMAISYRKTLKYGEVLEMELLNIPDSGSSETYTAQLVLKDIENNIIYKFPTEKFIIRQLKDITFNIPTGQFADKSILRPELTITNQNGGKYRFSNLHYVRLHPTVSWDYQSVKQALRDQINPQKVNFTATAADKKINISGQFQCDETLASLEVLENEREIFAFDRLKEFCPARDLVINFDVGAAKNTYLKGSVIVDGASEIYARPVERPNSDFLGLKVVGNTLNINQKANTLQRAFLLRIPRKDVPQTVLRGKLNGQSFDLPVKRLITKRAFGLDLHKNQLHLCISRLDTQPDIPVRMNSKSASFNFNTVPANKYPVYSLRAITVSGKIYRSKPIMPIKPAEFPKISLNVWDESADKPITIKVAKSRIPDLTFNYDPANGDDLECNWSSFWSGEMGGGTKYGDTFNRNSDYPKDATISAPRKVKDSKGQYCLSFDGKGNYIVIPREAFPRGAFTLSFEVKPQSQESQVLFKHHGISIGSLILMLKNGKLVATFTDDSIKTVTFDTGLAVPINKWSKIKVTYNYKTLTFSINDKVKSYPFNKRALYFATCVFGGHTKKGYGVDPGMKFFKGLLKNIRIFQNAEHK
jgi:hypothetical protein